MIANLLSDEYSPSHIIDILRLRALHQPQQDAYHFIDDGGSCTSLNYAELDQAASSVAVGLLKLADPGARVLICTPTDRTFLIAFFGCLYAGMLAIPAMPLESKRLKRVLPRLQAIAENAQVTLIVTSPDHAPLAGELRQLLPNFTNLTQVSIEVLAEADGTLWQAPAIEAATLAMLMYTSGSTGRPKGAMVSHENIMHNLANFPGFHARPCKTVVSWLPLYHDLGLFLSVLHPLYQGALGVLFAAETFVRQPLLWLELISRYQATTTGAPSFAYDLCVRKIDSAQREKLDLRHWTMALNGAEPVRSDVLTRFSTSFACAGFRAEAFYPSYGMSDATATVTGPADFSLPLILDVDQLALKQGRVQTNTADTPRSQLVSCGVSIAGQELLVVDPQTKQLCTDDCVGELWLRGPSITQGYWNLPDETNEQFQAYLTDSGDGPFFRTGDLGFLHSGQLFVVGRYSDMIIIRGQNYYPEELEQELGRCHPALVAGGGAVCAVEAAEGEQFAIVHEVVDPNEAGPVVIAAIQEHLAAQHGLQALWIALIARGNLPKTSSGKISRHAAKTFLETGGDALLYVWHRQAQIAEPLPLQQPLQPTQEVLRPWLIEQLSAQLAIPAAMINPHLPFSHYGLDSLQALELVGRLEQVLNRSLAPTLLWEYSTIAALAHYLSNAEPHHATHVIPSVKQQVPVAIIGMSCRFPDAENIAAFWDGLVAGFDGIHEIPSERWDLEMFYDPDRRAPGKMYGRWAGFLDNLEYLDTDFFGISPREAPHIDPQQRLLLEVTWEALEDAGIVPEQLAGSPTGVFIASLVSDYCRLVFSHLPALDAYSGPGSAPSILANRLSYFLNLRGPSVSLNTACSGSLVAIHQACQSLQMGESSLALVGGVSINLLPDGNIFFAKAGALSPDGRCKPFAADANGIVRSEGVGMLVLKPLAQAVADGNHIHAVILGSAVNSDGRTNGIMAPNREAQVAVLQAAYAAAGISPQQIQYIEAHGTGTSLGDVIEAEALGQVVGKGRTSDQACRIGSVKSNIGHTESAAGVAGVIKVALAMRQRILPSSIHCSTTNPLIPFEQFGLAVQQQLTPWPAPAPIPALAGVSGFGFGGTNAHIVLQEYRPQVLPAPKSEIFLLPISGHTQAALKQQVSCYLALLANPVPLASLNYALSVQRTHHSYRRAIVGHTQAELADRLALVLNEPEVNQISEPPKQVWVFSGQGSHWARMGLELFAQEPIFAATLSECDRLLRHHVAWSLISELERSEATSQLDQPSLTQPAIFAIQVALAALLGSWGLAPDVVVGHSLGEISAAYVAGALSLEEAILVVSQRSRLMQQLVGQGKTALIEMPLDQAQLLLVGREDLLAIAGSNSPDSVVLAGDPSELERLVNALERKGVFARMLQGVELAFHSPQMDQLQQPLIEALQGRLNPRSTTITLVSTVTGEPIDGNLLGAAYWARNLREPFRFGEVIQGLLSQGQTLFIELSPHAVLTTSIVNGAKQAGRSVQVIPTLRRKQAERRSLFNALAALYETGVTLAWDTFVPPAEYIPLPAYAWQRSRYWYDQLMPALALTAQGLPTGLAGTTTTQLNGLHPLLGYHIQAATGVGDFWQTILTLQQLPFLADHQVQQRVVMPGAAYVEMVLAAAEQQGQTKLALTKLAFKQPLALTDVSRTLQLVFTPNQSNTIHFQIDSCSQTGDGWTTHAVGQLDPSSGSSGSMAIPLTLIQQRCQLTLEPAEHYAEMASHGLSYGEAFQAIIGLWQGEHEALAQLQVPALAANHHFTLHPVLLDAAFQIMAAATPAELRMRDNEMLLPIGIECLEVFQAVGLNAWCHAQFQSSADHNDGIYRANLTIFDSNARVCVMIEGLQLRRITSISNQLQMQIDDCFYTQHWEVDPSLTNSPTLPRRHYLLFADRSGLGKVLCEQLNRTGVCTLISADQAQATELGGFYANPDDYTELRQIIETGLAAADGLPTEVVYLWPLDVAAFADPMVAESMVNTAIVMLQGILATQRAIAHVWLVTRGIQPIPTPDLLALGQMPMLGIGRALVLEHPELQPVLLDLDPQATFVTQAKHILQAFATTDPEQQLAYRNDQRYVVRLMRRVPTHHDAPQLRAEAAYLITGGRGGVGLAVAKWLATQGVRRLILIGRSDVPPRNQWECTDPTTSEGQLIQALREIESLGTHVLTPTLDVANKTMLQSFLNAYRATEQLPIRGVIHAAGVLRDQLIATMTPTALAAALRPKLTAAWVLHELFQADDLDFFVLFSSLASVFGSIGQANYAAGNAFLDGLAYYRRQHGLAGLSLNWGPWGELGMALDSGTSQQMQAQGLTPLPTNHALAAFASLLGSNDLQTSIVQVDWSHWFMHNSAAAVAPFFNQLRQTTISAPAPHEDSFLHNVLLQANAAQRETLLEAQLKSLVGNVLRMPSTRLDRSRPLLDFGIDSIMGIELKNGIEKLVGITLPISYLLQGPSIEQMTTRLLAHLYLVYPDHLSLTLADSTSADMALELLQQQAEQQDEQELMRLLAELEALSPDEIQSQLSATE